MYRIFILLFICQFHFAFAQNGFVKVDPTSLTNGYVLVHDDNGTTAAYFENNKNQYYGYQTVDNKVALTNEINFYDTYYLHTYQSTSDTLSIPFPRSSNKGKKISISTYNPDDISGNLELVIVPSSPGDYFVHDGDVSSSIKVGSSHSHWQASLLCMQVSTTDYKWVTISQ